MGSVWCMDGDKHEQISDATDMTKPNTCTRNGDVGYPGKPKQISQWRCINALLGCRRVRM
jgi:hypothetical protein